MADISFDDLMNSNQKANKADGEEQKSKENKPKKQKKPVTKKKKVIRALVLLVIIALGAIGVYNNSINEKEMQAVYEQAQVQFEAGNFEEAYEIFNSISSYSDAASRATECLTEINNIVYNEAMNLKEAGEYDAAILKFGEIADFGDVANQIDDCYKIKRELYIDKMGVLIYKINKYKELAVGMCDVVNRDWNKAQQENKDVTVALQETFRTWEKDIRQLRIGNDGLKSQVESLGELETTEQVYDLFSYYFLVYEELHKQAVEPSGEIRNYKERVNQYSREFDSVLEKIYVTEPSIKAIVNREVKAAEKAEKEQEVSVVPTKEKQGETKKDNGANTEKKQ